jgi:multiple sugar transport system ATP-binding protein
MSTIDLRKIGKRFGAFQAVKDVDLSVKSGEVVCLLGPSGCGKTTTLRMIAGLERVTSGDVIIAGQNMNDLPPAKRDIAMVFQFYALYPALTVGENLAMPLHYEGVTGSAAEARVNKVAEILELTHALKRLPGQISEGEKQRVAVARAIIRDPNCFLFDEPLSRLDVELRHTMRGQIKSVLSNLSKATVIVTHDQLEALTMADRIAIMRDGIIEQDGTPHDVFAKPANLFVAGFIGTPQMNLLSATLKDVSGDKATIMFGKDEIRLPVPAKVASLKGQPITLGIRPRALTPSSANAADSLQAQVELIEPMGAETLIHARGLGGEDIRVVLPREKRVKIGEALNLALEPRDTHIFGQDGKAVR